MQPSRFAVLALLSSRSHLTSRDVAHEFSWSRRRAAMALLRAPRVGLVARHRWVYSLSQKGQDRLEWIQSRGGQ